MKQKSNKEKLLSGALLLTAVSLLGQLAQASGKCDNVGFAPSEIVVTRARDQIGPTSINDDNLGLVDIHTFNHFYTFQVDRDVNERNEGVVIDLTDESLKASTSEGFAFRLRTEFNSAEASRTGMGFKATFGYKKRMNGGYIMETLAEVNSQDTHSGAGTVSIDLPSLPAGRAYQLRYEFGQKEVLRNTHSLSMEEDSIASGDQLVSCNLPFFTQELMLVDRRALKTRVKKYNQEKNNNEVDLSTRNTKLCNFELLDAEENIEGPFGINCEDKVFSYPLVDSKGAMLKSQQSADDHGISTRLIAEYPVRLFGQQGGPATQLFKIKIGSEFAFGAGLRVLLRRVDNFALDSKAREHPFACLLDQSCQFAYHQEKNHIGFQVVITSGEYLLEFYDHGDETFNKWLVDELELKKVPFSLTVNTLPIFQNEVRDHCPFMYLMEEFIQKKYIDGQTGQKFHFADKIVMNLSELRQEVIIVPELDSILKVVIREAYGVNAQIQLCHQTENGMDCFMEGRQIGTTEILYYEELQQDVHYRIILDYSHSVIALHNFDECPHLPIEISVISQSEADLLTKSQDIFQKTDKKSREELSSIFSRLSDKHALTIDDPMTQGAFTLTSRTESDFEVLYSQDFFIDIKMGLFLEIFYSPFDDEVMELFIGERYDLGSGKTIQADLKEDYDNDDKANRRMFELNKFKSSKTIWIDLMPGDYTVQILMLRSASKRSAQFYEKVNFQLYLKFDFINVSREVFLPGSLNYHGLLGVGDETHDFGHITLLWDDLTLWHDRISTTFTVASEMASVAVQVEQPTDLVKVHLSAYDQESDMWQLTGSPYVTISEVGRIDTVEEFQLVPGTLYKIEAFKDMLSEHAHLENVEMGERYSTEFSIKIDFSEFDESHLAQNLQKAFREVLPVSIDQVSKVKKTIFGLQEKSFTMGNPSLMHLVEYGDGWQDMQLKPTYVPKEERVFVAKQTENTIVASIPFEVHGISEAFYAGIYELTQGVNLMSLHIVEEDSHSTVAISKQGKHFSTMTGVYLPQGSYYLVVKSDRLSQIGGEMQAPLEFVLDVIRHVMPEGEDFLAHQVGNMQMCPMPEFPTGGLTKPGYVHSLSGGQVNTILQVGVLKLDSGTTTSFTISEDSQVNVYIETSFDIPVALQVQETGGVRKAVALSEDQDRGQSNFLKQMGFTERNVVQLREILAKGSYWFSMQAVNEDALMNFDSRGTFCNTYKLAVTIQPIKNAQELLVLDGQEEQCEETQPLVSKLVKDGMVRGELVRELTHYKTDIGYFDFENDNLEGPFMLYFHLDYDMSQEGVVAIVLSHYDAQMSTFTEIGLYTLNDQQSTILQVVERGTYAVSIQSINSTPQKFQTLGFSKQKLQETQVLNSHCFRATYTYMISSTNEFDSSGAMGMGQYAIENRVRVMETIDDLRGLVAFTTCHHDEMPRVFPVSDEGFERQYAFKISQGARQVVELVVEEPSLIHWIVQSRSRSTNKVQALLFSPEADYLGDVLPIGVADDVHPSMVTTIVPGEGPHRIEFVHQEYDLDDPCPVFDFRIAVKPLPIIPYENLQCMGYELPPHQVDVTESTIALNVPCAFSSDMLIELNDGTDFFEYDIVMDLPHSDFFLDAEIKSDFLTGDIKMRMMTLDKSTGNWIKVGKSQWVNQDRFEDISNDAFDELSTKIGDQSMVQKLRYYEDVPPEILETASHLMLQIQIKAMPIIDALSHQFGLFDPRQEQLCFNFDLSIFLDEMNPSIVNNANINKLVRVDWHGKEQSSDRFDQSGRINAFLQFEKSISQHIPDLKNSFQSLLYLKPIDADPNMVPMVSPSHFKAMHSADNTLVLSFEPWTLFKGTCYELQFEKADFGKNSLAATITETIRNSGYLKVCTSACDCDNLGTARCMERGDGQFKCQCHPHFTGRDCSQCEDGFFRNHDGYCEKTTLCVQHGGTEDCSRHGQCLMIGNTAECHCDPGFADNGKVKCGRCSDPLMKYPYECASSRTWVLQQDDNQCGRLKFDLPRLLHKDPDAIMNMGLKSDSQVVYQHADGNLEWAGRYSLKNRHSEAHRGQEFFEKDNAAEVDKGFRHSSKHKFFVRETSVYHLFLSNVDSNVKIKFTIYDSQREIVAKKTEFIENDVSFGSLVPSGRPQDAEHEPWTIHLEFEHEHQMNLLDEVECPMFEIHFIVEPVHFHVDTLECSPLQQSLFYENNIKDLYTFSSRPFSTSQKIVLPSHLLDMADQGQKTIFLQDSWKEKMVKIEFDVNLQSQGAFSLLVTTDFSEFAPYLSLREKNSKKLVGIDKDYMLDDVETSVDHLDDAYDVAMTRNHKTEDHIAAIEKSLLQKGLYTVTIAIPQAHWFRSEQINTCLGFTMMLEFVPKDNRQKLEDEFVGGLQGPVEVLSVMPLGSMEMQLMSSIDIFGHFDRNINVRDAANNLPEYAGLCQLRSLVDPTQTLKPAGKFYQKDTFRLNFDFAHYSQEIKQVYNENKSRGEDALCWEFFCKEQPTGDDDLYFTIPLQHKPTFCFAESEMTISLNDEAQKCNPLARAKLDKDGKCICTFPYRGNFCEKCDSSYTAWKEHTTRNSRGEMEQHTLCVPNEGTGAHECNGFGTYNEKMDDCNCEQGYAGRYCQLCYDQDFQYPDCTGKFTSSYESSSVFDAFTSRRQQQAKHLDHSLDMQEGTNPFQQQCPQIDYPNHLNQYWNHKESQAHDFHIADVYTFNHDAENFIQFRPLVPGLLKILVKQPEKDILQMSDEVMRLEVGIARADGSGQLVSGSNHYIQYATQGGHGAQTDFAVLDINIVKELVNEQLIIFIVASDQTNDAGLMETPACTQLYLEMEFRKYKDLHKCESKHPEISATKTPIALGNKETYPAEEQVQTLLISDVEDDENAFFYGQDFFLKNDGENASYDVEVQLSQKFIDQHIILPFIEVMATDLERVADFDSKANVPRKRPICHMDCHLAGHRTFNAFNLQITVPAGTIIRVWLYQSPNINSAMLMNKDTQENCVNYALSVRTVNPTNVEHEQALKENLYCEHTRYLPRSLNRLRYLGEKGGPQTDFNYIENFRVDNLKHEGRSSDFELQETTVVRIDGIEHEHLTFYLSILDADTKKVIANQEQAHLAGTDAILVPSIFTVLKKGSYTLKVEFIARESEILRQPCQSIQIQIAMNRADEDYLYPRQGPSQTKRTTMTMPTIVSMGENFYDAHIKSVQDEGSKFQILLDQEVRFQDRGDLNLLMKANSDFLRADVSFMLVHIDSGHHFMPQHIFENGKKMAVPELPPGFFRMIVFLQNVDDSHNTIFQPAIFSFNLNLFSFYARDHTYIQEVQWNGDSFEPSKPPVEMGLPYATPEKLMCLASGRRLPQSLTKDVLRHQTDFSFTFSVFGADLAYENEHAIEYQPEEGEDILRVQVDQGIKLKLYKASEFKKDQLMAQPITKSHSLLGGQVNELVRSGLDHRTKYVILIVFAEGDEDFEMKSSTSCLQATLQVKVANSDGEFACLDQNSSETKKRLDSMTKSLSLSYQTVIEKGKHLTMVAHNSMKVSVPEYIIEIKDENTDLEVTIEETDHLFGATIKLIPIDTVSDSDISQVSTSRGMPNLLDKVFGKLNVLEPARLSSPKHMTKLHYQNLGPGKFKVQLHQPSKLPKCLNIVDVLFQVYESLDARLSANYMTGTTVQHRYQSSLEFNNGGALKIAQILPVALDGYRLYSGGQTEQHHILFSDYYALNDNESRNQFTFGKLENNDTYVRLYGEDDHIKFTLVCTEEGKTVPTRNISAPLAYLEQKLPQDSSCTIKIVHSSKQALNRKLFLQEKIRITVMVANIQFIEEKYKVEHRDGLSNCVKSVWPLALDKNTEILTFSTEQAFYNLPLVRYNLGNVNYATYYPQEMTTYYFRLNETNRFYFELGSNFLVNHAVLRVSSTQKIFGNYEIYGKQMGNLNVLDQDLAPGDYKLEILGYKSTMVSCGMFSLKGILNLHSAMGLQSPEGHLFNQGPSVCQVRSTESVPLQIYPTAEKTRKGNEAVIDPKGNFFHNYRDQLIVRSHQEVLKPWSHETLVTVPEASFLMLQLSSEQADDMMIHVRQQSNGNKVSPSIQTQSDTGATSPLRERKAIWKLEKEKPYIIEVQFGGDTLNQYQEEVPCLYYDLVVAINSVKWLGQHLDCANTAPKGQQLLIEKLPREIGKNEPDFSIDNLYHLRYPEDFKQIAYRSNGKQSKSLIIPTKIDKTEPFSIVSSVAFDIYMADFTLKLYQYDDQGLDSESGDNPVVTEVIQQSGPLLDLEDNDEETFMRKLQHTYVDPNENESEGQAKYFFSVEESHAFWLFNEVSMVEGVKKICLPLLFKLQVTSERNHNINPFQMMLGKESMAGSSSIFDRPVNILEQPTVVDYKILVDGVDRHAYNVVVPFNVPHLSATVLVSQKPMDSRVLKMHAFTLAFTVDGRVLQKFSPKDLSIREITHNGQEMFSIALDYQVTLSGLRQQIAGSKHMSLVLQIDPTMMKPEGNSGTETFVMTESIEKKLKESEVTVEFPEDIQAKRQSAEKGHGSQIKDTIARAARTSQKIEDVEDEGGKDSKDALKNIINAFSLDEEDESLRDRVTSIESMKKVHDLDTSDLNKYLMTHDVQCQCVHGTCRQGEATCDKCYDGWKGKLCDIPLKAENVLKDFKKYGKNKILEQGEEEEILAKSKNSAKRITDDDGSDWNEGVGRRSKKIKDKLREYQPRKEYSKGKIDDEQENEDGDLQPTVRPGSNRARKSVVIDDDEDYHRDYQSQHGSSYSSTTQSQQKSSTKPADQPFSIMQSIENLILWIFQTIVEMIEWIIYILVIIVCLIVLKTACEKVRDRVQATQQKKRKGKRKRQSELNEDGMGASEHGRLNSDDDDDGSDGSPIEMEVVNRSRKDGLRAKRHQRSRKESEDRLKEGAGSADSLQLYDQDDESGTPRQEVTQPQERVTSGQPEYNPFDDEPEAGSIPAGQDQELIQLRAQAEGEAVMNEIDGALSDDDEFGNFV